MTRTRTGSPNPVARHPAWILVGLFVAVATAFNAVVPVFEAADEHTHYFFAQHIALSGELPVQTTEPELRGPWEQEGSQPPLYYLVAAPVIAVTDVELTADQLWFNHQNTMGQPRLVGNENRFVHPPAVEGWPWRGYALAVHAVRGLSTLLAALTVVCVWLIARRVLAGRPWLALTVATVVAFNPQFLHLGASISNDNAINLLAAASLVLLLRVMDGRRDGRTILALALVAGLAPLAKLSGLAVVGFALATLGGVAWRERNWRDLARTAGPLVVATAVLSGWWYLRNIELYGSITGLDYMLPDSMRRAFHLEKWLRGLPAELYGLWLSTWGIFGWFTVMLPTAVFRLISALAVVAFVGVGAAWRERVQWVDWPRLGWLGVWGLVVLGSLLRWLLIAKGAHGRLLFPAIASLAIVLVVGWRQLLPSGVSDRRLALGVSTAMLILALFGLWGAIRPAYAMPRIVPAAAIPESAIPAGVVFDGRLRLIAVTLPERVVEGDQFRVTLYWQATEPIQRDGFVAIRIDQSVAPSPGIRELAVVPGEVHLSYLGKGARPPSLLTPGLVYVDEHLVRAPALASPALPVLGWLPAHGGDARRANGEAKAESGAESAGLRMPVAARLSVHIYDSIERRGWPARSSAGAASDTDFGTRLIIDPSSHGRERAVAALRAVVEDDTPAAVFENGMRLYAWPATDAAEPALSVLVPTFPAMRAGAWSAPAAPIVGARAGTRLTTPVVWYAEQEPAEDLTLFVHLVAEDGRVVAQFDGPPASHGSYPTSVWRAGEEIVARIDWSVPPEGSKAVLTLLAGLYRPVEGLPRLAAYGADGERWPDEAVVLLRVGLD